MRCREKNKGTAVHEQSPQHTPAERLDILFVNVRRWKPRGGEEALQVPRYSGDVCIGLHHTRTYTHSAQTDRSKRLNRSSGCINRKLRPNSGCNSYKRYHSNGHVRCYWNSKLHIRNCSTSHRYIRNTTSRAREEHKKAQ